MRIYTTAPLEDPREVRRSFPRLEAIGYDGAFTFEAKHDPFLPLVAAAEHTTRLRLGTAIAIAFARSPMNLANLAYGLQVFSEGRFVLGLGSQVRPHVEHRFSMPWSQPAKRMREIVLAIRAAPRSSSLRTARRSSSASRSPLASSSPSTARRRRIARPSTSTAGARCTRS